MNFSWNRWYSFKSYIRSALWIVPVFSIAAFMVFRRSGDSQDRDLTCVNLALAQRDSLIAIEHVAQAR